MKKIIFANGSEVSAAWVSAGQTLLDGQTRQALTVHLDGGASLDAVDAAFSDAEATARLRLVGEDGEAEGIFEGYTIKVSVAKALETVAGEDGAAVGVERVSVQLAKKTLQEVQLEKILAALAANGIPVGDVG